MSDLEKTTISVKTLIIAVFAVLTTFGIPGLVGVYNVVQVNEQITQHGRQLDALQSTTDAVKVLQQQLIDIQKRRDAYQPYKWSTPMMRDYNNDLQTLNPQIKTPDPQEIHNKEMPYTP